MHSDTSAGMIWGDCLGCRRMFVSDNLIGFLSNSQSTLHTPQRVTHSADQTLAGFPEAKFDFATLTSLVAAQSDLAIQELKTLRADPEAAFELMRTLYDVQ